MLKHIKLSTLLFLIVLAPLLSFASGGSNVFQRNTLLLLMILVSAKLLGLFCERFGIPELVGELFAGIFIGNMALFGAGDLHLTQQLLDSEFIQYAAELSVVILLFLVGLESSMGDLLHVGVNAFTVAVVGVILPTLGGVFFSEALGYAHGVSAWFVGATFAATSVGITARVLGQENVLKTSSSKVILGAAVIDDILGILILAVLAGVVSTGSVEYSEIAIILAKATGFFVVSFAIGKYFLPGIIKLSSIYENQSLWTALALILALVFAEMAAYGGLAPIIGAFVGGLVLEDKHFIADKKLQKHVMEDILKPITDLLLPIFFVTIGAQVKLSSLSDLKSVGYVLLFLVIAVISKALAGYCVRGKGFDKLGIGIGMVPRGEVGLIFASVAMSAGVFNQNVYSILVLVVLLTTIIGPLALKFRIKHF